LPYERAKVITGKHLEKIASMPEPEKQAQVTSAIIGGKLSAKQAEKAKEVILKGLSKEGAIKTAKEKAPPAIKPEEAKGAAVPILTDRIVCPKCGAEGWVNWIEKKSSMVVKNS
jgi:hypothetical protein